MGGQRILITPELGEALGRLQHGETGFEFGGVPLHVAGLQQDMHNVLRDLQESPLGARANQLEAMTIELVAMLFDFIFETRDLPDSIKALVGRLQIPVLKAAMLDGALLLQEIASFAAPGQRAGGRRHRLVADDGPGRPALSQDRDRSFIASSTTSPTTSHYSTSCERTWRPFSPTRKEPPSSPSSQRPTKSISATSRKSRSWSPGRKSSVGCASFRHPISWLRFCATNGSTRSPSSTYAKVRIAKHGSRRSATLDDLVWSVQPKRITEDRRKLVAMLRNLLRAASWRTSQCDLGAGRARAVHVEPGGSARGGGQTEPGLDSVADGGGGRSGNRGRRASDRQGRHGGSRARRVHWPRR